MFNTFDPVTHIYRIGDERVPSVTEITKPLTERHYKNIADAVIEAARDRGKRIHWVTQLHDEDDLDESSIDADITGYYAAYRRFLSDTGARVVMNECQLFDSVRRYAGTPDRLFDIFGTLTLVDLKSTALLLPAVAVQLAGYENLVVRALNKIPKAWGALHLMANGRYQYVPIPPADWPQHRSCFSSLQDVHRWKERHDR